MKSVIPYILSNPSVYTYHMVKIFLVTNTIIIVFNCEKMTFIGRLLVSVRGRVTITGRCGINCGFIADLRRNSYTSVVREMVTLVVATAVDPASIGPAAALLSMPGWHPGPSFQVFILIIAIVIRV